MKISVTVKIHPLCTSGQRENFKWASPWGAVYMTSQGDSSVKILRGSYSFCPLDSIDHTKTRRMASAKCSRAITALASPTDEVSIG